MRPILRSLAVFLVVASPALAQTIEFRIVKLNDKGVVEVNKTIMTPTEYTYTVQVPVQVVVNQNGQQVVQVQMVTEQRRGTKMTQTTAFVPLEEKDAIFTDLQGKAVSLADIKKPLEKGPIAVIAIPKDAATPSAAILQAFKTETLILRVDAPVMEKKTTGAFPLPRRILEEKREEIKAPPAP